MAATWSSDTRAERSASRPAWCAACGQAVAGRGCTNRWCRRADRGWSVVYSVGCYQGELRRAIVGYKYRDERYRAPALAGILARYLQGHHSWFEEYDLVTDVPAFVGPGARRPWSPVGVILDELAARLGPGWDVRRGLVAKVAETEPMNGLGSWDRARVAEGPLRRALRVTTPGPGGGPGGGRALAGARVLVVDDVFTEGSTLREVARALRAAGAEEVAGLVLARPGLQSWRVVPDR